LDLGEWFNADPEAIIAQALQTGGGPNVSDAYTINGLPGPLYNCSAKGIKYKLSTPALGIKNVDLHNYWLKLKLWTYKNKFI